MLILKILPNIPSTSSLKLFMMLLWQILCIQRHQLELSQNRWWHLILLRAVATSNFRQWPLLNSSLCSLFFTLHQGLKVLGHTEQQQDLPSLHFLEMVGDKAYGGIKWMQIVRRYLKTIFFFHSIYFWTVWENPMAGKGKITATEKMFKTAMPFGGFLFLRYFSAIFCSYASCFLNLCRCP